MISRTGKSVPVAYSEVELIWLRAANRLPPSERWYAIIDISEMTGRLFSKVWSHAGRMATQKATEDAAAARAILAANAIPLRIMVPERSAVRTVRKPKQGMVNG